jgi:hypothetical protein
MIREEILDIDERGGNRLDGVTKQHTRREVETM